MESAVSNLVRLLDPTDGIRASLSITPTESISNPSATFFIAQIAGSTYLDLFNDGRSVVALRGLVGLWSQASRPGLTRTAPPALLPPLAHVLLHRRL